MRVEVNQKSKLCKSALESNGFKLSRTGKKYFHCNFSKKEERGGGLVSLDGAEVPQSIRTFLVP